MVDVISNVKSPVCLNLEITDIYWSTKIVSGVNNKSKGISSGLEMGQRYLQKNQRIFLCVDSTYYVKLIIEYKK